MEIGQYAFADVEEIVIQDLLDHLKTIEESAQNACLNTEKILVEMPHDVWNRLKSLRSYAQSDFQMMRSKLQKADDMLPHLEIMYTALDAIHRMFAPSGILDPTQEPAIPLDGTGEAR